MTALPQVSDGEPWVVAAYFPSSRAACGAANNLWGLFERVEVELVEPTWRGRGWRVEVTVPPKGPMLHGLAGVEEVHEAVDRWNGLLARAPAVPVARRAVAVVVGLRPGGRYLLVFGDGRGQIADAWADTLLDVPEPLDALVVREPWTLL